MATSIVDRYSGWYSVRQEAYFDESETTVGEDGVRREPLGSPVEWNEEESYFFRLSAYQDRLLDALRERSPTSSARPSAATRSMSFVKSGLKDLSISRTHLQLGRAGAGRREARDVCVGRCAHQLHHRAPAIR